MEDYRPIKVAAFKTLTPTYYYARIIGKESRPVLDLIHKITSAVLVSFFYALYMGYNKTFATHRYMTINGLLMTLVTRWLALIHCLMKCNDRSVLTRWVNLLQTTNFAVEGAIFFFYWTVIAAYDYTMGTWNGYVHSTNIFNHLGAFLLSTIPVFVERTRFRNRHFYLFTLPLSFGYLIFVFLYNTSGRDPVYKVLTFDNLYSVGFAVGSITISAMVFYLGYFLSRYNENRFRRLRGIRAIPPLKIHFRCMWKKRIMQSEVRRMMKNKNGSSPAGPESSERPKNEKFEKNKEIEEKTEKMNIDGKEIEIENLGRKEAVEVKSENLSAVNDVNVVKMIMRGDAETSKM